jgi:AraC family transcriptional regulator of adaptative response/methylated-DNA-[protein]-cysteine methyltransferase
MAANRRTKRSPAAEEKPMDAMLQKAMLQKAMPQNAKPQERMKPQERISQEAMPQDDYRRVEAAILYLEAHYQDQPTLEEIAAEAHLSKYHFQRLFTRWAGVSPKRYLQALTLGGAKAVLADAGSVLDATYETGLSSPGRLHDLFVTHEAVTPGEFKALGAGLAIRHGFGVSPFGTCLVAATARGVCWLSFHGAEGRGSALAELQRAWPHADLSADLDAGPLLARIFPPAGQRKRQAPVHLVLRGTPFQLKVWEALLEIPSGEVSSYGDVARRIGQPSAARAVGNAVAHNPVAFLIPCHRVIRQAGGAGSYRWGAERKRTMLAWETARRLQATG